MTHLIVWGEDPQFTKRLKIYLFCRSMFIVPNSFSFLIGGSVGNETGDCP